MAGYFNKIFGFYGKMQRGIRENMKTKSKFKKRYLIIFGVLLILFYFGPSILGGYSWTEYSAIRYTFPNEDGKVVFQKEFGNKKVVIWDTGKQRYVKLIENTLGLLYRSTNVSEINAATLDEKMIITWSGSQNEDEFYDTLFAAEVLDDDIVKVVISNDDRNGNDMSLSEGKEHSTLFVEMDVINGYAAYYSYLPYSDVGNFVFRGFNSDGKVVSVD